MKVIDPGHKYELWQLGTINPTYLTFVKRSGGAIQYKDEWPGLQTQEVLRAVIDRSKYLNDIIPCAETEDAIYYARMALFMYEVRAYRRKQEELNRKQPKHDDSTSPKTWRRNPFADVPFSEHEIELRPIGPDGHIIIEEQS